MAHTKAKGTSRLGRDSQAKRLGVKILGDQFAKTGNVIIRQKGTKFRAGKNTSLGNDYTIYSMCDGVVKFKKTKVQKFNGRLEPVNIVSVEPAKN